MSRLRVAVVLLSCASVSGCATPRYGTFEQALQSCRMLLPARTVPRYNLTADHPLIQACLQRHGWKSDGNQLGVGG